MQHGPPKQLDASFLGERVRPRPRILQFGGGNFMRAFFDLKVDLMNEASGSDWGIVIIRAIAEDLGQNLNDQDGLYTVIERGLDNHGREVSEPHIVSAVRAELFAQRDWDTIRGLARHPEIRVVTSNTTDAGIALDGWDMYADRPPKSFPAKLTRLLHERWKYLGHARNSGWQVIPCELIEDNGGRLSELVTEQARIWGLESDFLEWLHSANTFYNTLVDRIVPGFPVGEEQSLADELGYQDKYMVVAERFHFLAVERKVGQPELVLPLAEHDPGTIITENVNLYRSRKVSILNGAHTALCPLALMAGFKTVRSAVDCVVGSHFLTILLEQEIMPRLPEPRDVLASYASTVLQRFANPFIQHRWHDIALSGLAKFQVRLLPHLLAGINGRGEPPRLLVLSLAAWLAFYLGRFPAAASLPPRDTVEVIGRIREIGALDNGTSRGRLDMVTAFLQEATLWGANMDSRILRHAVADCYGMLTQKRFDTARFEQVVASLYPEVTLRSEAGHRDVAGMLA